MRRQESIAGFYSRAPDRGLSGFVTDLLQFGRLSSFVSETVREMVVTELTLFDYGQLDVETRITVKQRTEEIKTLLERSARDIRDVGNKLIEVKAQLGHGNFGAWLEIEFEWDHWTATQFMNVARRFQSCEIHNFGASALYLLAAPSTPEPARIEAIERADAGEKITRTIAKEIVAQHRPPAPAPQSAQRTYESTLSAVQSPPIDRRPSTPAARPLTDNEVEAVIWRAITVHALISSRDTPQQRAAAQLGWLQRAEVGDFSRLLNPGVSFEAEQVTRIRAAIEDDLSSRAKPAIPEPEAETDAAPEKDENYTPPYIIRAVRDVLGKIDLDPASSAVAQRVVLATVYLTKANDSLRPQVPWLGRVWLNPPFSSPAPFTNKLIEEYEARRTKAAILLVNNGTETQWGQALLSRPYPVCFVGAHAGGRSRIDFWQKEPDEPRTGNRYAQMIFYLGKEPEKFREVFSQFGVIR